MKTETVTLSELRPPDRNVRAHPPNQVNELARAVKMFGITRPIVIDESGMVLVGNGLFAALQRLGHTTAPALRLTGLSESDKRKIMLSDNKIFSLGVDDYNGIMQIIRELDDDLDVPGFDEELLRRLTVEVDEATTQSMNDFGRLKPEQAEQYAGREIPRGTTNPDTVRNVSASDEIVCPRCGHLFVQ